MSYTNLHFTYLLTMQGSRLGAQTR